MIILNIIFKKIYISNTMHTYYNLIYTNVYFFTEINEETAQMNIGKLSS